MIIREKRIPSLGDFEWQQSILDMLATPPSNPVKGDRYIVISPATSQWAGHEGDIAWYDGSEWRFDSPADGWLAFVIEKQNYYRYQESSSTWIVFPPLPELIFAITSFSCTAGSSGSLFEIGIGGQEWKPIGTVSFSATYENGPAIDGYVSHSGWTNLSLGAPYFVGPATNVQAILFPSVDSYIYFTLHATDGVTPRTASISYGFCNRRFWGTSTIESGYTESDVESWTSDLGRARTKTFTVTPASDEYIVYAHPSRYGVAEFWVGGFQGGFSESPEVVSITNSRGYQETYYVYRSTHRNLGMTTVTVT